MTAQASVEFPPEVTAFHRWEAGAEEGDSPWESLTVMCALILTVWEQLHSQTQPWPQPPFLLVHMAQMGNETSFLEKEQSISLISYILSLS